MASKLSEIILKLSGFRLPFHELLPIHEYSADHQLWISEVLQRLGCRTNQLVHQFGEIRQDRQAQSSETPVW